MLNTKLTISAYIYIYNQPKLRDEENASNKIQPQLKFQIVKARTDFQVNTICRVFCTWYTVAFLLFVCCFFLHLFCCSDFLFVSDSRLLFSAFIQKFGHMSTNIFFFSFFSLFPIFPYTSILLWNWLFHLYHHILLCIVYFCLDEVNPYGVILFCYQFLFYGFPSSAMSMFSHYYYYYYYLLLESFSHQR